MAGFVQIIQFQTSRIDEIRAMQEEYRADAPETAPTRVVICADRDRPNAYVVIAEFDSYEKAMENSNNPRTSELAARTAELCDAPATFLNLDVTELVIPAQARSSSAESGASTTV